MKNFKSILYFLFVGMIAWSCDQAPIEVTPDPDPDPTPPPTTPDPGTADFSNFISIGNSLTAGVQGNALFDEGQANSMPLILHTQFSETMDAGDFNQPDINHPVGYSGGDPVNGIFGRLLLQGLTDPTPTPQPSDIDAFPDPTLNPNFLYTGATNELNNFGVGGILLGQALIPETGDWALAGLDPRFNPFYARFASNPGTSTILGDALSAQPTFFSFWLGNNDVLGYATTGASGAIPLTDPATFAFLYEQSIAALTLTPGFEDVKGVVGNVPFVTSIPFFFTVPWNAIPLDQATADLANAGFAGYNAFLDGLVAGMFMTPEEAESRKVTYVAGANAVLIDDESLTDITPFIGGLPPEDQAALTVLKQARPATSADLVTLSAGAVLGTEAIPGNPATVIGVGFPAADQYILTPEEQDEINNAIVMYNASIVTTLSNLGVSDRVAVADMNTALLDFVTSGGIFQDGVLMAPTLAPPYAAWSEDGVHPNARGYAFTANVFIDAINAKFGAAVPHASLADYAPTALPIP